MANIKEISPKEFYNKFSAGRMDHENTAKSISELTLPYIMMEDGASSSTQYKDKISQAFCGRLVNTLKSKMGMSLLPPSTSSFRLEPDKDALETITQGDPEAKAVIYAELSARTAQINKEIEAQQIRDTIFDMLTQLIVVGSIIMEKKDSKGIKLHTLRNFTVDLDATGEPRAMCVVEKLKDLPEGIDFKEDQEEYMLYTLVERDYLTGSWILKQSIDDVIVGEEITYKDDTLPFQYVGWTWTDGDKYHRPYAEDYLPDMDQYNQLSNLITKGSIVAAKVILFVDEKGNRTRKSDVANSKNGAVLNGRADDVTALQLQKNFDFQIPMERLQDIGKNLASAFLMNESVTRDAERVTAQEIRFMAQELEMSSLSGVYSKLAKKVSKRIVQWVMAELKIKFKGIDVNVITGLDALGRSQEAQKLDGYVQRLVAMNMMHWLDQGELAQRYASFDGIDTTGLLKTPNQVAQEQAQAQAAQAEQMGVESFAQQAGQSIAQPQ
jgi:hypothetical protein